MDSRDKRRALIAHLFLIGWVIALIRNNEDRLEFTRFYIRQMLGLLLLSSVAQGFVYFTLVKYLGYVLVIGIFLLWLQSFISAMNGKKQETPLIGGLFQRWFKSL